MKQLHLKSSVFGKRGRGDESQAGFSLVQPTTHHLRKPMASQLLDVKALPGIFKTGGGIQEVIIVHAAQESRMSCTVSAELLEQSQVMGC